MATIVDLEPVVAKLQDVIGTLTSGATKVNNRKETSADDRPTVNIAGGVMNVVLYDQFNNPLTTSTTGGALRTAKVDDNGVIEGARQLFALPFPALFPTSFPANVTDPAHTFGRLGPSMQDPQGELPGGYFKTPLARELIVDILVGALMNDDGATTPTLTVTVYRVGAQQTFVQLWTHMLNTPINPNKTPTPDAPVLITMEMGIGSADQNKSFGPGPRIVIATGPHTNANYASNVWVK